MHHVRKGEGFCFPFYSIELNSILASEKQNRTVPVNANGWYWWAVIPGNFRVLSKGVKCLRLSETDFYSCFRQRCWNITLNTWWSENVICCSGPCFVLHYITSLDYISVLALEEVMLTCLKRLKNSRIKILQDCLMQRHHLWLRKFTNRKSTDARRVFWINITADGPWLFYCSPDTC